MANTVPALNPEKWVSDVQDFLNALLVAEGITNMRKFDGLIKSGDQVNWPQISDQRVQSYTPGTDLTIDDFTATQSSMTLDQSKASTVSVDPEEVMQAEFKGYPELLARQAAFVLSQELDQSMLKEGVDNASASNTVTGGTLSASTIYSKLTDALANLQRSNAADGPMFAVLDPERVALLAQSEVANGFNLADSALKNGFVGNSQAGFKIFNSNNLPTSSTLTLDTQPTATDTMTIAGVTWTWVADGTAANAGELNVGANLADAKVIFVQAINGVSTADVVDISLDDRRKYQNAQVSAATFVGNDSVITAFGKQNNSETFTAATNVFGTETGDLLTGRMGAVSVGRQMRPMLHIRPEPKQLADNYITHHLYGRKVFTRDADRLARISMNV